MNGLPANTLDELAGVSVSGIGGLPVPACGVSWNERQPETVTVNIPEGYVVGTPEPVAWAQFCALVEREEVSDV